MAVPAIKNAFTAGELSPSLYGRTDLARYHLGASTFRNGFVSYRGGFNSRAGTLFVGYSMQTGRAYPPRLIPFQFNINQGLALEFGNLYMRVISNGGYVLESPFGIVNITQASPAVVTTGLFSVASATANNGAVTGSYNTGDEIELAGGTFTNQAWLLVNNTTLLHLLLNHAGTGYAPGDIVYLAGGSFLTQAYVTVLTIGGGGAIATFALTLGGVYTTNAAAFTQASTTGAGFGATFNTTLFGPNSVSPLAGFIGTYSVIPSNPVAQASIFPITEPGLGATFNVVWNGSAGASNLNSGDWVFIEDVGGMVGLNGSTFVINVLSPTTFQLFDVYGNPIDTTGFPSYSAGGTVARVFTLTTPYNEQDIPYLKFTQSADVMSICCVNQETLIDYQPQDLTRNSDSDWSFSPVVATPTIAPPASLTLVPSAAGSVFYDYVVTSISGVDGSESIASVIAFNPLGAVDIAATLGTISLSWPAVAGAVAYNIYKAQPCYLVDVPAGAQFGYAGTAFGTSFIDNNIVQDFTQAPPTYQNPFSGGNGFYPSVPTYFQERRVYANTLAEPDTYFMSQPGAFLNFDSRIPTIASDAIIGSPWSVEVNGIQFMVPMPGGLVVLTGLQAWQLTGTGGSSLNPQAITPFSQQAQPQAYNGCSPTVPPIRIDYDIVYVQAKGSIVRDLSYQFYVNIYTGVDLTLNSSQLFTGFMIKEWAWAEEPYKIVWAVRDDGILLSLTYLKAQEIAGWARSDTQGLFQSVCSVTEPPVDAIYLATQRFPSEGPAYMIERMDNRIWTNVEDTWCVDCGLALTQPQPDATLSASSATGLGACASVTNLVGGHFWSAGTTAAVVDDNGQGPGTGAVPALTIVGGVITAVTFSPQGTGYISPKLVFTDPANAGSGASATIVLNNSATFTADEAVFSAPNVGSVIRMGGGIAVITTYTDPTHVVANIISPIVGLVPGGGVLPQPSGSWTMTAPVSTIGGLQYLAGMMVTGLADGNVIPPTLVPASGSIALAKPASAVTVGLGFQAQLQSIYLDTGEPTTQGQRKKVAAVTARIEASRGLKVGTNQPDGATLSPPQIAPQWFVGQGGLTTAPDKGVMPFGGNTVPLFTGDVRVAVAGGFNTKGQVALQQDNPLPMNVLAMINEYWAGDIPQTLTPKRDKRKAA